LEIGGWQVSIDSRKPKLEQYCRDILVLEFDRALRPIDLILKDAIVFNLAVRPTSRFVVEHRKIVGDDESKLVISPIAALNRLTGHHSKG
jgi:hypothetical protein